VLRGSGRSIPGVHLRDVLDLVDKREPGLLLRFGGHAMAAGLSMRADGLARLADAFEAALGELADPACFTPVLATDGSLADEAIELDLLAQIEAQVWGQGFPEPVFADHFSVERQSVVGERHLKLALRLGARRFDAIAFGRTDPVPTQALIAYRLLRDDWQGRARIQLVVEAVEAATAAWPVAGSSESGI
jgi:single-stranded-DNA-specific exonuclease